MIGRPKSVILRRHTSSAGGCLRHGAAARERVAARRCFRASQFHLGWRRRSQNSSRTRAPGGGGRSVGRGGGAAAGAPGGPARARGATRPVNRAGAGAKWGYICASFSVSTPLGVRRTRFPLDATSSGAQWTPKSWQYRTWRSGCARRNNMCACVQILTSNTALVESARNSPKSTMYHYPGSG